MPANKFATIRYHVIDKLLRNKYRAYPSVEDIMEKCEDVLLKQVSRSSIEKDIRAMKFDEGLSYFAPIEYSREYKGYYYSEPEYSIDSVPLNEDEIEAVEFATNILAQFKDVAIFKNYENAIEKVLDKVKLSNSSANESEDYIQFENIPTIRGSEFLSPLLSAIRSRNVVQFDYQSFKSTTNSQRIVSPYLLKEFKNRWYLLGMEKDSNLFKVFGLERMNNVSLLEEVYQKDLSFNRNSFFQDTIGITTHVGKKPETVELLCNPILLQYLETQPLHSSQVIELTKKGAVVTLCVMLNFELEQIIMGFGDEIEVLKPKALRKNILERHLSAAKKYK